MRKSVLHLAIAALALTIVGCASVLQPASMDFVRGCWTTRGGGSDAGNDIALLRLLPDPVSGALQGNLTRHSRDVAHSNTQWTLDPIRLDIRSGMHQEGANFQRVLPGPRTGLLYVGVKGNDRILITGDGERLSITAVDRQGKPIESVFAGWRDGCD